MARIIRAKQTGEKKQLKDMVSDMGQLVDRGLLLTEIIERETADFKIRIASPSDELAGINKALLLYAERKELLSVKGTVAQIKIRSRISKAINVDAFLKFVKRHATTAKLEDLISVGVTKACKLFGEQALVDKNILSYDEDVYHGVDYKRITK